MTERRNGKRNATIQSLTDKCRQSDICIVFLSENKHNADETKEQYLKRLRNMGYRKQSDTVREFVYKVLQIGSKRPLCLFNEYKEGYIDCLDQIKELAAEYGVNTEDLCD